VTPDETRARELVRYHRNKRLEMPSAGETPLERQMKDFWREKLVAGFMGGDFEAYRHADENLRNLIRPADSTSEAKMASAFGYTVTVEKDGRKVAEFDGCLGKVTLFTLSEPDAKKNIETALKRALGVIREGSPRESDELEC
jgi:hypothetical protein